MAQCQETEALASSDGLFVLQPLEQDELIPRKPSIILVCPSGSTSFTERYFSILAKMLGDAHLIYALNVADIHRVLCNEGIADSIAGFVVTDARIMGVDTGSGDGPSVGVTTRAACKNNCADQDEEMVAMSNLLKDIVHGKYAYGYEKPQEKKPKNAGRRNRGLIPEFPTPDTETSASHDCSNRRPRHTPRQWAVVFAFDFPAQAACHPLRFGKYMMETFGLGWRICGATQAKWQLGVNEQGLRKMGERVYRGDKYEVRCVFLDGVVEDDKVLIVKKKKEHDPKKDDSQKEKQKASRCLIRGRRRNETNGHDEMEMAERVSSDETDNTTGEEPKFTIERVEVGDRRGGWKLAADRNGPFFPAPGEDSEILTPMLKAELRREERDWADDELTTGEEEDDADTDTEVKTEVDEGGYEEDNEDEDDDSNSNSSSDVEACTGPKLKPTRYMHTIYVNFPDQRGSKCESDADDVQSPVKKKQKKSDKPARRVANCPVALHSVKTWFEKENRRVSLYGFVGFVGHVEDNRSMASLILGMCGVRNIRLLPSELAAWMNEGRLR
ncbi:hypothetical protein BDW74DRAFT_107221 [Aspergillus multicolor]|uniref:uncharacterized protein n=1 Tax=Aspergillus multicolor TaxID=41759 RepID=UPI003CCD598D